MPDPRRPMSAGIRLGLALFAAGVVFIVIDAVPFLVAGHHRPLWLNLACLLAPAGLAIVLGAALGGRPGRAARRRSPRRVT